MESIISNVKIFDNGGFLHFGELKQNNIFGFFNILSKKAKYATCFELDLPQQKVYWNGATGDQEIDYEMMATFALIDAGIVLAEEGFDYTPIEIDFPYSLERLAIINFLGNVKVVVRSHKYYLVAKEKEQSLREKVTQAIKEADKEGESIIRGFANQIITIKQYVGTSKRYYDSDFEIIISDESDVLIRKTKEFGIDHWIEKILNIPNWGHLCVPLDQIGCTEVYFKTKVKAIPVQDAEFIIYKQQNLNRLVVIRIDNEDEYLSGWDVENDEEII